MLLLDLIILTIIICYIIDLSGIQITVKKLIWKFIKGNTKEFQDFNLKFPFCSLCMTHHILLIYLLCLHQFSILNYLVVCLLSFFSMNITTLLIDIREIILNLQNKITSKLNK